MRRLRLIFVIAIATFAATAGVASAQAPGQTSPGGGGGGAQVKRERIKQRILTMRAWQLTQELQLDEATAAKVFPLLAKYDDTFAKLLREAVDLRRTAIDAAARHDDRALDDVIDKIVANQRARWDTDEARFKGLRKVLSAPQAARLLVVLPQIDRRIQNQLRRALGGGAAQPRRRGRGAGAAVGPDDGGGTDDDILDDDPAVPPQ